MHQCCWWESIDIMASFVRGWGLINALMEAGDGIEVLL